MHKSVQVSVIVAAKNSQLYIGRCLRSLLNQSFDQDKYEVIVINDGSTDKSIKIVKKKISSKKFIKLISLNKNYGQQIAIYIALKEEKADFYGALDSDSQQDSNLFIKMINYLRANKLEFLQMKKNMEIMRV